jgi:hypothetical protein
VIDAGADAAIRDALPEQALAEPELRVAETQSADRLSPWFLIGIVGVQLSWMGGLAYLLVRVLH